MRGQSRRNTSRGGGIGRIRRTPKTSLKPNVWQIVGYKNSGKTTMICALIDRLRQRGYTVAVIKHDHHSFIIDHPHTDTWHHREAGAGAVAITNSTQTAIIENRGRNLEQMIIPFQSYDFVLVEGFKNESYPKILLIHDKDSLELLSLTAISAVMVWEPMRNSVNMIIPSGIPQYEINDIEGIVRLIDK